MKKYCIIVILLALLLCGCAREESNPEAVNFAETPTIAIEEVDTLPILNAEPKGSDSAPMFFTAADNGTFALKQDEDGSSENAFVYFNDFVSGETYPICAKPNCTHDDYLCSAYLKDASHLYYDGSCLYYFSGTECQFWRMNTDGTDRKMLFQCNENAKSGGMMSTGNAVYLDGKVYFNTFGGVMNPSTGEVETGEQICVGDLKTGKLAILPIVFEENNGGSTLGLCGMYEDQLVIQHSNTLSSIGSYQKNEETVCLLDVNTLEVTVLCQWQWDTNESGTGFSFVTDCIDEGYMIFKIHSGGNQYPTYADGTEESVFPGDRLFVDLSQKKAYRMTNQDALSWDEIVMDGKWIYLRWNNDHTLVEKIAQDLSTGEISLLPEAVRDISFDYSLQSTGDFYIVHAPSEDDYIEGYILKEDYWAGKPDIVQFPDWLFLM